MQRCQSRQEFNSFHCASPMCLHFLLINLSAKKELISKKNYKESGYKNITRHLVWLTDFSKLESAPEKSTEKSTEKPMTGHR